MRALGEAQVADERITVVTVPGALETALALQRLAQSGDYDALVALGAVIRGDTYHFDIVANESAAGVASVQLECGIPIGNGILTCDTDAQAEARMDAKGTTRRWRRSSSPTCSTRSTTGETAKPPARPVTARRRARELVLQGLYERQLAGSADDTIAAGLTDTPAMRWPTPSIFATCGAASAATTRRCCKRSTVGSTAAAAHRSRGRAAPQVAKYASSAAHGHGYPRVGRDGVVGVAGELALVQALQHELARAALAGGAC